MKRFVIGCMLAALVSIGSIGIASAQQRTVQSAQPCNSLGTFNACKACAVKRGFGCSQYGHYSQCGGKPGAPRDACSAAQRR